MDILEVKGECSEYDCYTQVVNQHGEEVGMPERFVDYEDVDEIIETAYEAMCALDTAMYGDMDIKANKWMAKYRPDTR